MTSPTDLRLPVRGLHLLLPLAVLVVAALGAVSEIGQYVTGTEHFYGLGPLVDLDYQGNLPDWYLSMLTLVCAGLLAVAGCSTVAESDVHRYWLLLAIVFLFLSADRTANMIEPLGDAVLVQLDRRDNIAVLAWIAIAVPVAVLAIVTAMAILRGTPGRVRVLSAAAIAIYGLSLPVAGWEYPLQLWFDGGGQEGGEIMVRDLLGVLEHALQTLAVSLVCSAALELIARRSGVIEFHLADGTRIEEPAIPASA